MHIIHAADLHLDYKTKQVQRTTADGRNIRELDFFNVFQELVDIVIDQRPDAFVIAGDLFDTPRPSNIVIKNTINQFNRLEEEGIPTIVQGGNHDTPQMRTTTSAFESLMEIDYKYIHFIYHGIDRVIVGDTEFIVVPHLSIADGFDPETLQPNYKDNKYSVLVLHGVADGSDIFKQVDESREMPLGSHILNMGHTYIALGHYHKRSKVRENAWYAGSLENGSFGPDVQNKKGGLSVDLSKVGKGYTPKLLEVSIRKIVDFGVYDAAGKTTEVIEQEIEDMISEKDIEGALSRIKIINITKNIYNTIDKHHIKDMGKQALYFGVSWVINQMETDTGRPVKNEKIKDLVSEWRDIVAHKYSHSDASSLPSRSLVEEKGIEYLNSYQEEIDATEN